MGEAAQLCTFTIGDLYLTIGDEVMGANVGQFPTATGKISAILS